MHLASPADGPALADLIARSPDAGAVAFTSRFAAEPLAALRALATSLEGAVASLDGAPAGLVLGDFSEVQWAGERRPAVYVSNLRVTPELRRRGVARALARFGLDLVDERLGPEAVVYSALMGGNVLSAELVEQLGFRATGPVQGALVPGRRTPPRAPGGLSVRLAHASDFPLFAAGANAFYAEHDLWSPLSEASLADFAAREVAGVRPNQLYVVERAGELLAGLSVSDRTQLVRMVVTRAALPVRLLGRALGILPAGGDLRALTIRHVWLRPGALEAARFLWQTLRFEARTQGRCLGIAYDPRDALAGVFQLPRWLPTFDARYLVRAAGPVAVERPTYC
ncbi:MAG: GNAT family N-acetyltransferase, partial [Myxococcota bacterium]